VRQNWDDLFPTILFSDAPVATWHINIRELWPIAVSRILLNLLNVPHEHWHIGDNFNHRSIIDHAKSIPLPIVLGEAT
jgi:hypothetical protein